MVAMSFPARLHQVLSDIEELGKRDEKMKRMEQIFGWEEDGRSFKIHSKQKFIDVIMPSFFPRIKYSSFIRQLHTFGFKRVPANDNTGALTGALYHDLFQRGMPEIAKDIRKVEKPNKSSPSPSNTPKAMSASATVILPSLHNNNRNNSTGTPPTSEAFLISKVSNLNSSNQLPVSKVMLSGDIVPVRGSGSGTGSPLHAAQNSNLMSCMTSSTASYVGILRSCGADSDPKERLTADCLPSIPLPPSSSSQRDNIPSSLMPNSSSWMMTGGTGYTPTSKTEVEPPTFLKGDDNDFLSFPPGVFTFPVVGQSSQCPAVGITRTTTEGCTSTESYNHQRDRNDVHEDFNIPFLGLKSSSSTDLQGSLELLPDIEPLRSFEPSLEELDLIFQEDL